MSSVGTCPVCGVAQTNLNRHIRRKHPDYDLDDVSRETYDEDIFSTDEPPQPKPSSSPTGTKKAGGRRGAKPRGGAPTGAGVPLVVQLQLPYQLGSNIAAARGFNHLAGVLDAQALPCAQAWDQFLMRYPALREKIEQGMIATDIVGLIMAHVPIVSVLRMEIQARQMAQDHYEGGLRTAVA